MARSSRKEPLSKERIELAALELIEREGLAGFSTRKLASDLRCEAMSIYHYFPSKGHLLDGLVDRVLGSMPPLPDPELPWIERVRALGWDWRAMVTARPNFFLFMATHRLNTPKGLAWLDGVLELLGSGGLSHEDSVRMFRAIGYYLMGAGLDETAGYARGPSTVEPVPDFVMRERFPNVVAAGQYFSPDQFEPTFRMGWDLFLESWERRAEPARKRA